MLSAQEIRSRYLDFFARKLHQVVPSGSLVPRDDPSLLFANAGMVQFKKLFVGEEKRPYTRATTCQKCLRVSGKHNDLENVGRTARHHTFFEMLGNFSFGDYFKEEAITWAWEFVTEELGLPREKLWVTIYQNDDEAARIWERVACLPPERIIRMGEKDNFWTMGDTGPCGPCSEIYYDQGEDMACGPDCGIGKCDCDRFLEIWNLVFTQYDQREDGTRVPLAAPNIDTGMGLERVAAVCQGKRSNFDSDLFQPVIDRAAQLAGVKYARSAPDTNDTDTALRVIADHARAAAFLIAEGILPANEGRGYVLRRLIRRAARFAKLIGSNEPLLNRVALSVVDAMGDVYPELKERRDFIQRAVYEEEKRFSQTLDNGLALLDEKLDELSAIDQKIVPGEFCFKLYDTYGFPLDIVVDVAGKRGFEVDAEGFRLFMAGQRKRARENWKQAGLHGKSGGGDPDSPLATLSRKGLKNVFVGYETLNAESEIIALLTADGRETDCLDAGKSGFAITATTPFYGESGGQIGDVGELTEANGKAAVKGAVKPTPDLIVLEIKVDDGEIRLGQKAVSRVDADKRLAAARNHTCAHLLQAALRKILGTHVAQAGSLVDADRVRFDFSHFAALTAEELAAVERDVNGAIMADYPVEAREMPLEKARESGAIALFSEKYGDIARVVSIGDRDLTYSAELCGGTHLRRTGQAGAFLITAESAVGSGVRRIEAVTGWNAYNAVIHARATNREAAAALKTTPDQIPAKARATLEEIKKLRKEVEKKAAANSAEEIKETVNGVTLIEREIPGAGMKTLRSAMDNLRGQYPADAVILLAGIEGEKVNLLLHVSGDLTAKFAAPILIKELAAICGGSGGGRPDLAQAGGAKPGEIKKVFAKLKELISR